MAYLEQLKSKWLVVTTYIYVIGGTNAQSNPQDGVLQVLVPLLF